MSIRELSENISVCGQIHPEHMSQIAEMGYKTVVNNRPDGEEPGQPTDEQLKAAALLAGLVYYYLPMSVGAPPSEAIAQSFKDIVESNPKPVFAFCRSGNRSGQIYMASKAKGLLA